MQLLHPTVTVNTCCFDLYYPITTLAPVVCVIVVVSVPSVTALSAVPISVNVSHWQGRPISNI